MRATVRLFMVRFHHSPSAVVLLEAVRLPMGLAVNLEAPSCCYDLRVPQSLDLVQCFEAVFNLHLLTCRVEMSAISSRTALYGLVSNSASWINVGNGRTRQDL
ncbi:hypothetical protein QBC36DRAFT_325468 [Triangularia setosa]|uniref:Uncharacterized protein n=1 Tax=Triangularia setosa TaxID=2587417 RepID=A0AAN6WAU3_9PEZI|nr:hypothetical protein QBC36DRAFT_325468 [Podospora setosa]